MAYSWDNRVKFVVRYMYDIDNNGFLDKNDFECLAVRNTVIEGKGNWDEAVFKKNQEVMANLWNEIAELADFNKVNNSVDYCCHQQQNFGQFPLCPELAKPVVVDPFTVFPSYFKGLSSWGKTFSLRC